jgi:hypothetical protein
MFLACKIENPVRLSRSFLYDNRDMTLLDLHKSALTAGPIAQNIARNDASSSAQALGAALSGLLLINP